MLRLAGREGDGAIINWLSADDVSTVAPIVQAAGTDPETEVVARIFVAPTTDRDTVMALGRYAIAAYLNVPVYAAFHRVAGSRGAAGRHVATLGRGRPQGARWRPSPIAWSTS